MDVIEVKKIMLRVLISFLINYWIGSSRKLLGVADIELLFNFQNFQETIQLQIVDMIIETRLTSVHFCRTVCD
jgi:hypothetical protein